MEGKWKLRRVRGSWFVARGSWLVVLNSGRPWPKEDEAPRPRWERSAGYSAYALRAPAPCAANLPMEINLDDREPLQMAMSRGQVSVAQARHHWHHWHHCPQRSRRSRRELGALCAQGPAPLPVRWAPMPLPGILRTCSAAC